MRTLKKVLMGVLAIAALGFGGAALAGATSGNGDSDNGNDRADEPVSGAAASQAGAAASKAVGGGDVISVERSDEGGKAVYEVKVKHAGTVSEVNLDRAYGVTAQKVDDDQGGADENEGGGATDDDGNAQGDGETDDDGR
jgi:uncharacterized membrane protein YkoI